MIDKKYFKYVFVAMMTISMTLVLSLISTTTNQGDFGNSVIQWLLKASTDFAVAFPTALAVAPLATWAAKKITTCK